MVRIADPRWEKSNLFWSKRVAFIDQDIDSVRSLSLPLCDRPIGGASRAPRHRVNNEDYTREEMRLPPISKSLNDTFPLRRSRPARILSAAAAGTANMYVCVWCMCVCIRVPHTDAAQDQLLYRYWIITQYETARPRSRVRMHTFHLHTSRPLPSHTALYLASFLAYLPPTRSFSIFRFLGPLTCLRCNAPRIKLPSCVRPCSFIGIRWMAVSRSV